jgi:hypothetical protein
MYALRCQSFQTAGDWMCGCEQTDEELLVWMREASGPTFTKLHRRIEGVDLKKGDNLTIFIGNSTLLAVSCNLCSAELVLSVLNVCVCAQISHGPQRRVRTQCLGLARRRRRGFPYSRPPHGATKRFVCPLQRGRAPKTAF